MELCAALNGGEQGRATLIGGDVTGQPLCRQDLTGQSCGLLAVDPFIITNSIRTRMWKSRLAGFDMPDAQRILPHGKGQALAAAMERRFKGVEALNKPLLKSSED